MRWSFGRKVCHQDVRYNEGGVPHCRLAKTGTSFVSGLIPTMVTQSISAMKIACEPRLDSTRVIGVGHRSS